MDGKADLAPVGSGHPQLVPYQAFPTADGYVVIAAGTNKTFRELCAVLGCTELTDDARFRGNQDRVKHREALVALLEPLTRRKRTQEWLAVFDAADIPSAPVNDMAQGYAQLAQTSPEMVQVVDHPTAGALHLLGVPFGFSASRGDIRRPPPRLGEHTVEVLRDILGTTGEEIERLRASKVVG
jgi:crotonobetainyl-CoA:carnitine CoA-transferase CaiB-like acyl-CoA transferase